jgi:aminoglycoside 3-N-acetyltransferase
MTFYHFVEESQCVDYRYFKNFQGSYQNSEGVVTHEEYSLFVRDLERGVITDVNRMGEILWAEDKYKGNRPGVGNGMRTIHAESLVIRTTQEITQGRALQSLYSIE